MKKILFLLILTGCIAFSDCKAKSETGVKKLASESKKVGFEKVYYTFLGTMPDAAFLYLYNFNMEVEDKKIQYTIIVNVKDGYMMASQSGNYDDLELVEANMKEVLCSDY